MQSNETSPQFYAKQQKRSTQNERSVPLFTTNQDLSDVSFQNHMALCNFSTVRSFTDEILLVK